MKKTTKIQTRFGPDTRFRVDPLTFRATETTELEELKNRMLRELLANASNALENTVLRRAANDAAALAWLTRFPLLVFPILLEERATLALKQAVKQAEILERSAEMLPQAA
jgi:hypothetical protein